MAICFIRANIISRSGGKSATAAAAYRSGEKIVDRVTNKTHDYTKKEGIDYSKILTPIPATNRNKWLTDRSELWNRVEATEKRYDAQLAREMIIAIPRELDRSDQINLVREYVQTSYVDRGMIADINLHHLDGDNPHAHVMLTMRELKLDEQGTVNFGNKDRTWNDKKLLETQIKEWSDFANQYLERAGLDTRIDSRSYEEQGIARIPQIHLGKNVTAMRAKGISTERGDLYDQIERTNQDIRQNLEKIYQAERIICNTETYKPNRGELLRWYGSTKAAGDSALQQVAIEALQRLAAEFKVTGQGEVAPRNFSSPNVVVSAEMREKMETIVKQQHITVTPRFEVNIKPEPEQTKKSDRDRGR